MKNRDKRQGLHIAVDSLALLSPTSKNRGIGNYAYNQFQTILKRDTENDYYFFNIMEELKGEPLFPEYEHFHSEYFYCGNQNFLFKDEIYEELIGNLVRAFIRKYQIDVFYITSPFESNFFIYKKEWFHGVKTVATVYDIIPYMMKEHYFKFVDKKWYMDCINMLRFTDTIFTISQSAKDDMVKCLSFPESQIKVIWGAVGNEYREISIDIQKKTEIYQKFGIRNEFIMCTGGDDERKNIAGLIEAYSKLPDELKEKYQLVIVCKLSPVSVERYTDLAQRLKCGKKVILTNFVTFDELLILYNLATLLAFPSKYEGFGLPIVEAWACGTAVLTSNNSSLVQIAGDAAVLVDPKDTNDITRGLEEALTRYDLRELAQKGKERLKLFQWEKVADTVIEGINDLKSESPTGKEKIAMFTPLPPIQSGIADYSTDIINEICHYFDIDVFIDDHYNADCNLADNISVYKHSMFKKLHGQYKEIIYQMGNSDAHFYMYSYIQKYPGIVVLHDLNLNGAAMHFSFAVKKKNKIYEQMLKEDFDETQTAAYMEKVNNGMIWSEVYNTVLNGYIINYAKKVIVHSDYAREKLLEKDIRRIVSTIPLYAPVETAGTYEQARRELDISDKIVLGCFGHIHATKRAVPILKAFSKLRSEYENIILYYVGKLDPSIENEFFDVLKNNDSLEKSVMVTGYVDMKEFNKYMDCIDIALNLRYPYNGENSASAARLLQKGKCVLISNIGSFAEIPDSACIKLTPANEITPEKEVQEIYNNLKMLLESIELRTDYGVKAAKYAKEDLSLEKAGRKYKSVIENDCTPCLDEKLLERIHQNLINYPHSEKEMALLVKTLAFTKKADFAL